MHNSDAAAQLLEDAGLGGVSPAAGAAVAAGVAAPDRVDRPGILVVEVQLVEVQPELVIGQLDLPSATEASMLLLNQIQVLNQILVPGCNERYPRSISHQVGRLGRRASAAWAYTLAGTGRRSHTRPSFARTSRVR